MSCQAMAERKLSTIAVKSSDGNDWGVGEGVGIGVGVGVGTAVYAQVDSAHNNQAFGAVFESHERRNQSYNNILARVAQ